MMDFDCAFWFE
jgi:hypothetical protein